MVRVHSRPRGFVSNTNWWPEVEKTIERYSLLKHPFYQAWQMGELKVGDLKAYARMYYPHVAAFPRYVSGAHSVTADLAVRQLLLENLIEEERGSENHPELWARFSEGLGLDRSELSEKPAEAAACVATFERLSKKSALSGLAALYAYESQIPAVSETKIAGLKKFYGIENPEALKFFKVHAEADVWHSGQEKDAIVGLAKDEAARREVLESVEESCKAVWGLLDEVWKVCSLN